MRRAPYRGRRTGRSGRVASRRRRRRARGDRERRSIRARDDRRRRRHSRPARGAGCMPSMPRKPSMPRWLSAGGGVGAQRGDAVGQPGSQRQTDAIVCGHTSQSSLHGRRISVLRGRSGHWVACRGASLRGQREAGPGARGPDAAGARDQDRADAAVPLRGHGGALRPGGDEGAPGRCRRGSAARPVCAERGPGPRPRRGGGALRDLRQPRRPGADLGARHREDAGLCGDPGRDALARGSAARGRGLPGRPWRDRRRKRAVGCHRGEHAQAAARSGRRLAGLVGELIAREGSQAGSRRAPGAERGG